MAAVRIQQLIEQALQHSSVDGCVVIGVERTEANLRWAGNSLTTNGQMHSRSLTVISIVDGADGADGGPGAPSVGVVQRAVADPDEVAALVRASEEAARTAAPAEDASPLIEPYDNDDDWDAAPATTSMAVFSDFAPLLGQAFGRAAAADQLLYGFAEHTMTSVYLGTSTGLRRRFDQPTGRVEVNGKSGDLTRSAWVGAQTRDFADVDVAALYAELDRRLGWAANRVELPAGRYETLLPPGAVADLMINAYWTGSARDAEEGRNVFAAKAGGGATRIGERICGLPLTMRSDPDEPGMQCLPFELASSGGDQSVFDNGAPVAATDWIRDGVLTNLARNRNWARRTGQPFVPLIDNLVLEGAQGPAGSSGAASSSGKTLDEMIAATERGLLVTCLWYIREVDPQTLLLTGLTRDGVYLVENGTVTGAVNNFRFNESPVGLLGRITEVGRAERTLPREWSDYFTRAVMPPVRVPDFNMSTVSQAS